MTKGEFLPGWAILTAQPWGKSYRGAAAEAAVQIEFYFKNFERCRAQVWQKVCEQAATGDRWPSVSDLKQAVAEQGGFAPDPSRSIEEQKGPCITKEEFGLVLYGAISKCSEVEQVQRMIATDVHRGKDTAHLAEEYKRLKGEAKELAAAESISATDAAQLAREYPWLLT